jgi:hypothetical protein
MNAESRQPRSEQLLEQDLEALRSVWAGSESTEPPELVDRAILNTARRAIENRPGRRFGSRRLRWVGAFATATIVVLALSIVVQQEPALPPETEANGLRLEKSAPAVPQRSKAADPAGAVAGEGLPDRATAARPLAAPPAAESAPGMATAADAQDMGELRESLSDAPEQVPGGQRKVEAETLGVPDASLDAVPPEDWIEQMRKLLEAGRLQELERELAAFRTAWPDYELPPELQGR